MNTTAALVFALVAFIALPGCGKLPKISENRRNFAPWEKLPETGGIRYVGKFVRDPGTEPLYLALISYTDEKDIQTVVAGFSLASREETHSHESGAEDLPADVLPSWFALRNSAPEYVYPDFNLGYHANLWVIPERKLMILERNWF